MEVKKLIDDIESAHSVNHSTWQSLAEASAQRQAFKPYQQVVEAICRDAGANWKNTAALATDIVLEADMQNCLDHCRSLLVQGLTAWHFQGWATEVWAEVVTSLPESTMRFALNEVTNSLSHKSKLHLWGKRPSPTCQLYTEYANSSDCAESLYQTV